MFKFSRHILFALCLTATAIQTLPAQDASGEVFGGYAYTKNNPLVQLPKENLHGWMGGATGYFNRWFGLGLEIAGQFGEIPPPSGVTSPNLSFKEYSYLAGPSFRFVKTERFTVGAKLLLGGIFGQVRVDPATSATASGQLQPRAIPASTRQSSVCSSPCLSKPASANSWRSASSRAS